MWTTAPVVRELLSFLRVLSLWIAIAAYTVAGARADIATNDNAAVLIPFCSVDGVKYIEVDIDQLPSEKKSAHAECGCCLIEASIAPDTPLIAALAIPSRSFTDSQTRPASRTRSLIWPGAPPIGPPSVRG